MDGSFSAPSYNSIGDPYVDSKENKVHSIKGTRQFLTTTSKKGQTGADWGPGPRKFVGVSGQYQEYYKEEAGYRLQNTKKNLNTKGFTYGNPTKKRYLEVYFLNWVSNTIVRSVVILVARLRKGMSICQMARIKREAWPRSLKIR